MTKVTFIYENSLFTRLEIKGHSGYQKKGSDIVCSGISTAVFTSLNLIDKLTKNYQLDQNEEDGYISFKLNEHSEIIELIITNLIEMLKQIEANYQNHLQVKIENQ